jgi:hypothetical protein
VQRNALEHGQSIQESLSRDHRGGLAYRTSLHPLNLLRMPKALAVLTNLDLIHPNVSDEQVDGFGQNREALKNITSLA